MEDEVSSKMPRTTYDRRKKRSLLLGIPMDELPDNRGKHNNHRVKKTIHLFKNCVICEKIFSVPPSLEKRKLCSIKCASVHLKTVGKPPSRLGYKYTQQEKNNHNKQYVTMKGEKNWNWKGGVEKWRPRNIEWNNWRKAVFEKDGYICQVCGVENGNGKTIYLEAHHIKSWGKFPELRYNVNNGQTLCSPCHRKTESWGQRGKGKNGTLRSSLAEKG